MHDFSASTHSIPQLIDKEVGFKKGDEFRLLFAAESEMQKGSPKARGYAVTRDLIKLCLVECPIKAVVYRGYGSGGRDSGKQDMLIDAIVKTIARCPSPGKGNEGWLLIGLVGKWPDATEPYFHTLMVGDKNAKPLDLKASVPATQRT